VWHHRCHKPGQAAARRLACACDGGGLIPGYLCAQSGRDAEAVVVLPGSNHRRMGWDQRRWVWVVSPLPWGPYVWLTASPGCSGGGATSEGTGGARRRGADYAAVTRGSDGRSMGSARVLFLCGLFDPVAGVLRHHKRRPSARAKLPCGGLCQFAGAGCDARGAVPPALARCGPGCCPARAPWQGHASGPGCGVRAVSPTPATASCATTSAAHRQGRSRRPAAMGQFAGAGV
jgi:hypothetical protein